MNEKDLSQTVTKVLQELAGCSKTGMTLKFAKALMEKVEQRAQEQNLPVVIAVADQAANLVAVHAMDDAYKASLDIAMNKAYTAAGLKMSTAELAKLSQPGAPLYGIQNTNQGRIVIFGGGEPLYAKGRLIGAVGVSGGSLEQDTKLAAYAKIICEEVLMAL